MSSKRIPRGVTGGGSARVSVSESGSGSAGSFFGFAVGTGSRFRFHLQFSFRVGREQEFRLRFRFRVILGLGFGRFGFRLGSYFDREWVPGTDSSSISISGWKVRVLALSPLLQLETVRIRERYAWVDFRLGTHRFSGKNPRGLPQFY